MVIGGESPGLALTSIRRKENYGLKWRHPDMAQQFEMSDKPTEGGVQKSESKQLVHAGPVAINKWEFTTTLCKRLAGFRTLIENDDPAKVTCTCCRRRLSIKLTGNCSECDGVKLCAACKKEENDCEY